MAANMAAEMRFSEMIYISVGNVLYIVVQW